MAVREPSGFGKSIGELLLYGVSVSYRPVSIGLPAWKVTHAFALIETFPNPNLPGRFFGRIDGQPRGASDEGIAQNCASRQPITTREGELGG